MDGYMNDKPKYEKPNKKSDCDGCKRIPNWNPPVSKMTCRKCGSTNLVPAGTCMLCHNCGETTGCS